jgi:hypothetical protein
VRTPSPLPTQTQKIVPEEEWDEFAKTLATNLPVAFRITGFRSEADAIRHIIKTVYFPGLKRVLQVRDNVEGNADVAEEDLDVVPRALPWYVNLNFDFCLSMSPPKI